MVPIIARQLVAAHTTLPSADYFCTSRRTTTVLRVLLLLVTEREVQSLRIRLVATRKRCVAVIAARPATESPIIGEDYEPRFFDLLLLHFWQNTVRSLKHGVSGRLFRLGRALWSLSLAIANVGE